MDESGESSARGFLGEYGVLIVPPSESNGAWFVTLAGWDEEAEAYGAGTDGPLLDSREEALETAGKVMDWLATQGGEGDLGRVWQEMQQRLGAEGALEGQWPPRRFL